MISQERCAVTSSSLRISPDISSGDVFCARAAEGRQEFLLDEPFIFLRAALFGLGMAIEVLTGEIVKGVSLTP